MAQAEAQPQPAQSMQTADRYNSITSTAWKDAQERKMISKSMERYGIFRALSEVEAHQLYHKREHLVTGSPYHFAAIAVCDELIERLTALEQRARDAAEYEAWVYQQECERVHTQVLPVGGAK